MGWDGMIDITRIILLYRIDPMNIILVYRIDSMNNRITERIVNCSVYYHCRKLKYYRIIII
jgi:hypothetical protein